MMLTANRRDRCSSHHLRNGYAVAVLMGSRKERGTVLGELEVEDSV